MVNSTVTILKDLGDTTFFEVSLAESENVSHSVMTNSFATPWTAARQAPLSMEIPGENTGTYALLQEMFLTWG